MIMSVYERTREIGVMKVLGCLVGNIRSIFLMEAGFIGFFGGVAGIALSYLLSFVLNFFGGALAEGGGRFGMFGGFGMYGGMGEEAARVSIIPLWLVLLGMAFATGIGLVAGFYPANRAVRISALEAIKQE
jgi:ABC-type lipoprotein release transport system permease subunit